MPMIDSSETAAGSRPRGRRTKNMPDGRQALVRAGISAFARAGFDAADLRSIAGAAGVSPNLVRVHFGGKAELWVACLETIAATTAPLMAEFGELSRDENRSVHDRLREFIIRLGEFYVTHPDTRDFVVHNGTDAGERTELLLERLLRPAYESVRGLFAAGIAQGIVRSSHPAIFFALVNNALSQPSAFPDLLAKLAPEIDLSKARGLMNETVLASLLHAPA